MTAAYSGVASGDCRSLWSAAFGRGDGKDIDLPYLMQAP